MIATSLMYPEVFSDQNEFLKDFVNHEFINFMGVIVTITLASTANIHMALREKEGSLGEEVFFKTKNAVKKSATSLIWLLFLSVILVVSKPLLPAGPVPESLANCAAISVILWGVLVIHDITKLAFKL